MDLLSGGIPAFFIAGIIDGLNPCALAVLIFFFMLLLGYSKGRTNIMLLGFFFALGTFIVYFGAGKGVLHLFNYIGAAEKFGSYFYPAIIVLSFILAGISFRDAYITKFNPSGSLLQLPRKVKETAHAVTETIMAKRITVFMAFLLGAAVTFLEFLCTGQVYLGVLAAINAMDSGANIHLAVFNIGFILPIIGITLMVSKVKSVAELTDYFYQRVWVIKLLTGFLMLGTGLFICFSA